MVERKSGASGPVHEWKLALEKHVLILEAPYYANITNELATGAIDVLSQNRCTYDRVAVPGALEIPQALASAVEAGLIGDRSRANRNGAYAGVIVLGCVIRGETAHYDIVCNNTNHWIMETVIHHCIPLGNGILTVDTEAQAMARATGGALGKGGDAARACLRLILLRSDFAGASHS